MTLPLLIETHELQEHLDKGSNDILLVHVSSQEAFEKAHLPDAVLVTPSQLMSGNIPARGSVPSTAHLNALMSSIGLTTDKHVVVYDDEGGGWAGRFIWTLDYINHKNASYLNGGLHAWYGEKRSLQSGASSQQPSEFEISALNETVRITSDDILKNLSNDQFRVWDARSLAEHTGQQVLAQQGGHIPGAKHLEWTDLMDKQNHLRLLPLEAIQETLNKLDLGQDKIIATHCQSHHRSGLTYLVAKILAYKNILGYDGSWSDWGNNLQLPVEI